MYPAAKKIEDRLAPNFRPQPAARRPSTSGAGEKSNSGWFAGKILGEQIRFARLGERHLDLLRVVLSKVQNASACLLIIATSAYREPVYTLVKISAAFFRNLIWSLSPVPKLRLYASMRDLLGNQAGCQSPSALKFGLNRWSNAPDRFDSSAFCGQRQAKSLCLISHHTTSAPSKGPTLATKHDNAEGQRTSLSRRSKRIRARHPVPKRLRAIEAIDKSNHGTGGPPRRPVSPARDT